MATRGGARLQKDVDLTEEAELRRLEGGGTAMRWTHDARGLSPGAGTGACGQPATAAGAASRGEKEGGDGQTESRKFDSRPETLKGWS